MNFSDFVAQTSGIVKYSPNGDLVAVAKTFEVKVSHMLYITSPLEEEIQLNHSILRRMHFLSFFNHSLTSPSLNQS